MPAFSTLPYASLFALIILILAGLCLIRMLVTDWRYRRIDNALILAYAALVAAFWLVSPIRPGLWQSGLCALVVFLFTFFCFSRGWLGGGDAKLIPVVALWLGPNATWPFLLIMVLGGCLVAVVVLVLAGKRRGAWRRLKLPYGVAIVIAALVMMWGQYGRPLLANVERMFG